VRASNEVRVVLAAGGLGTRVHHWGAYAATRPVVAIETDCEVIDLGALVCRCYRGIAEHTGLAELIVSELVTNALVCHQLPSTGDV
jgi:hypothetical protein